MYKTIYVPVDNSDHSNQAIATAIALGRGFESKLIGCHVYAASLHDYRFKQMEYTLPEEYLEETELERQRRIHDSLITMGLELISDSYLEAMRTSCTEQGLEFEPRMMDGKHHVEITKDLERSRYDLTVIGALGIGRSRDSHIGSVCERVVRASKGDVWVVRHLPKKARNGDQPERERDTILVGIDGSPQSFGALEVALELAAKFGKKVETISVYDPYLHYSVFKGVVDVLTERASKVFRFEEQNQLHEEIIDTGLAQIYQSHLDVAERMAEEKNVAVGKTLLDGKAFQKVLDHVRKTEPWLLVIGRIGVHSDRGETGLGSNAENLLRQCPVDVLLSTRLLVPELDKRAEQSLRWTEDAERRFERVPEMVRGIARTAIYRLAIEQGHSVISNTVLDEAMARYMPKTARETTKLAETLALELARSRPTFLCKTCGVTSIETDPIQCSVCGGRTFEQITREMLDQIAALEGGLEVDTTYDGRSLTWTQEAKRALKTIPDMYQRRRTKARVEKRARLKKLPTVTLAFARQVIEEETGVPLELPPLAAPGAGDDALGAAAEAREPNTADTADERRLIARDAERHPLLSAFAWTDDAVERLFRVPSGFMRDRTQERIETLARDQRARRVDLAVVEAGIALGRHMMEELVASYEAQQAASAAAAQAPAPHAPAQNSPAQNGPAQNSPTPSSPPSSNPAASVAAASTTATGGAKCPFAALAGAAPSPQQVEQLKQAVAGTYLNEVGLMSQLAEERRRAAERAPEDR